PYEIPFILVPEVKDILVMFLIFGRYLPVIGSPGSKEVWHAAYIKIPLFILLFSIPFYYFGRILSISYHLNRETIGTIYCADFFGAALACFVTPFCFHYFYLPGVVFVFFLAMSMLALFFLRIAGMYRLIAYLDSTNNFQVFLKSGQETGVEIAHAWNEFSRVTLAKFTNPDNGDVTYGILHDNAVSNVHVRPFRQGYFPKPVRLTPYEIPFILVPEVKDILVMFAGCGAEMVALNEFAGGKAGVTGIEINPLVMELARDTPELKDYHLGDFYKQPNIHLRIQEGRSFLQGDTNKYDVIFIGSKAAATVRLSGHTRKYLDTEEAYELYVRRLKPGGVIVFDHQPVQRTLESLHWVFKKTERPALDKSIIIFNSPTGGTDLVVAPDGFAPKDVQKLMATDSSARPVIQYAPFLNDNRGGHYAAILKATAFDAPRTTDDRPYESELQIKDYKLFPSAAQQNDGMYYMSWTKITTLIFVCGLALVLMLVAYAGKPGRLPAATLLYLLMTGFCYLLVEIIFIAKLELFMQNPLVSMATVLSIFLFTSGLGSFVFRKVAGRLSMRFFPFVVALLVAGSVYSLGYINEHLLGLPMLSRIMVAAMVIAPVSLCLGMFYPLAIAGLAGSGHEKAIPVTYAISTLSSVIGATYAMTMVIDLGFNNLLFQAAIGYALLGLFVLIYSLLARENVLMLR
ncbi:MAG: hypothetical protein NTU83_05350, partial [Candidatus Hydrogenedentes bacterium]|nr:hypothetical protein [Candidatus Hydrogenedentota bacterium]